MRRTWPRVNRRHSSRQGHTCSSQLWGHMGPASLPQGLLSMGPSEAIVLRASLSLWDSCLLRAPHTTPNSVSPSVPWSSHQGSHPEPHPKPHWPGRPLAFLVSKGWSPCSKTPQDSLHTISAPNRHMTTTTTKNPDNSWGTRGYGVCVCLSVCPYASLCVCLFVCLRICV